MERLNPLNDYIFKRLMGEEESKDKFRRFDQKDLRGNPLHRWLKFFDKMLSEEELKELMKMDSAIKRAEKKLEYISSDEEALALYRAREDSAHERANLIYTGKMEGIEEGRIKRNR